MIGKSTLVLLLALVCGQARAGQHKAPPMTLKEAKALTKKSNPTLQVAHETLHQTKLLIDKAWSIVKPQWTATGTYTHYNTPIEFRVPDFNAIGTSPEVCGSAWNEELGFCFTRFTDWTFQRQDSLGFITQITQPIFLGRAISSIKSAYQTYDLAEINNENVQEYLLYTLEAAYLGALAARKFVAIAEHAVELRNRHLDVARAKYELGETTRISAVSAEIALNRAEQDLKSAQNSLSLAKEGIKLLIGQRRDFSLVELDPPEKPRGSLEEIVQRALSKRRDLRVAYLNLELAEQAKADAWYRFLPSLVATGTLRVADVKGFTNEYLTWNVGLALSIPLYDGGLRYAYLDEAGSKIRQANIQIDQTKQNITSEMHQLWLKMQMAEANLNKARRGVELAREQVDLAKVSFEGGATTHLEVLDANSVLFTAEINEAQEELNLHLSILRLKKALTMFVPTVGNAAGTTHTTTGGQASSAPNSTADLKSRSGTMKGF